MGEICNGFSNEPSLKDRFASYYSNCSRADFKNRVISCLPNESNPEFVYALSELFKKAPHECWRIFGDADELQVSAKPVKTIGIHYFKLNRGGAERVTCDLANMWVKMGYSVVIFSESEQSNDDYVIDSAIPRVLLPNTADLANRLIVLENAIRAYSIDTLVTGAWLGSSLPWDMLLCKLNDVSFVVHQHSTIRTMFFDSNPIDYALEVVYRYLDALIVLTRMDEQFWSQTVPRVWRTINPLSFIPDDSEKSSLEGEYVIWIGRLSDFDKRPKEALTVMKEIVRRRPQTKLCIVGDGATGSEIDELIELAANYGIKESIEFAGWQNDIRPYLKKASVMLMTSRFEGCPLSLAESLSFGIPCVLYELPYLEYIYENGGIIQVPQCDAVAASEAICTVLSDDNLRKRMGNAAFNQMKEIACFDRERLWKNVFLNLQEGNPDRSSKEDNYLIRDMLLDAATDALVKADWEKWRVWRDMQDAVDDLSRRLEKIEEKKRMVLNNPFLKVAILPYKAIRKFMG